MLNSILLHCQNLTTADIVSFVAIYLMSALYAANILANKTILRTFGAMYSSLAIICVAVAVIIEYISKGKFVLLYSWSIRLLLFTALLLLLATIISTGKDAIRSRKNKNMYYFNNINNKYNDEMWYQIRNNNNNKQKQLKTNIEKMSDQFDKMESVAEEHNKNNLQILTETIEKR